MPCPPFFHTYIDRALRDSNVHCIRRYDILDVALNVIEATMQIKVTKKRFTVDEYYKMDEVGIPGEQDRTEPVGSRRLDCLPGISRHSNPC